jgi:outer membrane immunogenic protein
MTCKHLSVAGISALLIAVPLTAAGAADMAVKARPSSLQSSRDSWTGLYLGAEDGGVFGASNQIDNGPFGFGPTTPGYKTTGALAGGTVGYNLRTGNWVWGLEGDMSWTNVRGGAHEMAPFTTSTFVDTKENWLATGRGRLGWSTAKDFLFYATGGIATGSVTAEIAGAGAPMTLTEARVRWGGTVGAGVETKITSHWSFKAEYLYAKFRSAGYFSEPLPGKTNTRSDVPLDNNIFRFGLNYALQ